MSLGLRLDLKQTQSIVLTPQLQQAIRLLQLSNLELAKSVEKEVCENPFLEVDTAKSGADQDPQASKTSSSGSTVTLPDDDPEWRSQHTAHANDQRLSGTGKSKPAIPRDEPLTFEQQIAQPQTLIDHVKDQLAGTAMSRMERAVVDAMLGYLDDDGYIRESDSELASLIGAPQDVVSECREAITQCDPCGIGSHDLKQCLKLQLLEQDRFDPAMEKLVENLDWIARAEIGLLINACGVDESELQEMVRELKALDPRPGRNFATVEPPTLVPDLFVITTRDGWQIRLNQSTLPKLIVDRDYYVRVRRPGLSQSDKEYLSERLQSANWLLKALDQRAQTMTRVAQAIFERQKPFLQKGPAGLKPLVLKQIAEATSLHESTVSRATADKYVATPHGTYPLKYFFSTAIADTNGQAVHSAEAIRQQIRKMIDHETPRDVLSDDQIVELLKAEGIVLARRTVAKYREAMGIGSSVQRRRARALERHLTETP